MPAPALAAIVGRVIGAVAPRVGTLVNQVSSVTSKVGAQATKNAASKAAKPRGRGAGRRGGQGKEKGSKEPPPLPSEKNKAEQKAESKGSSKEPPPLPDEKQSEQKPIENKEAPQKGKTKKEEEQEKGKEDPKGIMEQFNERLKDVLETINVFSQSTILKDFFSSLSANIVEVSTKAAPNVEKLGQVINSSLATIPQNTYNAFAPFEGLFDKFSSIIGNIRGMLEQWAEGLISIISKPIEFIADAAKKLGEPLKLLMNAFTNLRTLFKNLFDSLSKGVQTVVKTIGAVFEHIVQFVQALNTLGMAMQRFGTYAIDAVGQFTSLGNKLAGAIRSFSPAQANQIELAMGRLRATLGQAIAPYTDKIIMFFENTARALQAILASVDVFKMLKVAFLGLVISVAAGFAMAVMMLAAAIVMPIVIIASIILAIVGFVMVMGFMSISIAIQIAAILALTVVMGILLGIVVLLTPAVLAFAALMILLGIVQAVNSIFLTILLTLLSVLIGMLMLLCAPILLVTFAITALVLVFLVLTTIFFIVIAVILVVAVALRVLDSALLSWLGPVWTRIKAWAIEKLKALGRAIVSALISAIKAGINGLKNAVLAGFRAIGDGVKSALKSMLPKFVAKKLGLDDDKRSTTVSNTYQNNYRANQESVSDNSDDSFIDKAQNWISEGINKGREFLGLKDGFSIGRGERSSGSKPSILSSVTQGIGKFSERFDKMFKQEMFKGKGDLPFEAKGASHSNFEDLGKKAREAALGVNKSPELKEMMKSNDFLKDIRDSSKEFKIADMISQIDGGVGNLSDTFRSIIFSVDPMQRILKEIKDAVGVSNQELKDGNKQRAEEQSAERARRNYMSR